MTISHRTHFLIVLLLTGLVLACYHPAGGFGFIRLDDGLYLRYNANVKEGLSAESVSWAFSNFDAANWHPVTWLSLMIDVELFGVDPGASHWINVGLHLANTLLLFWLLAAATGAGWRSAAVAALFAVHPLHVESVAWISERKDVLSTFWGLLFLLAYVSYAKNRRRDRYLLGILFLAVGLMAKPMLVTFPFVLLLLDYWPLKRFHCEDRFLLNRSWPLVREKIPFFVMAAAASAVTLAAQASTTAVRTISEIPISSRLANAAESYVRYLARTLWPYDLSIHYPHPGADVDVAAAALAAMVLAGISAGALLLRRHPYFFTGWFWYLGTLVPVIGIVQVGPQAMADRYTYIPLIGIFLAAVWGIGAVAARGPRIQAGVIAAAAVGSLVFFGLRTHAQVKVWENDMTLFGHALAVNEENPLAHLNMGNAYYAEGDLATARTHYLRALELHPRYFDALNNLGIVLMRAGDPRDAEKIYGWLLDEAPDDPTLHYNLGLLLLKQRRHKAAIAAFGRAAALRPDDPAAYNQIGLILARRGNRTGACRFFDLALQVRSGYAAARKNRASFCSAP